MSKKEEYETQKETLKAVTMILKNIPYVTSRDIAVAINDAMDYQEDTLDVVYHLLDITDSFKEVASWLAITGANND